MAEANASVRELEQIALGRRVGTRDTCGLSAESHDALRKYFELAAEATASAALTVLEGKS